MQISLNLSWLSNSHRYSPLLGETTPRRVPSKTYIPAEHRVLPLDWSQDVQTGSFFNVHKVFNLMLWLFRRKSHTASDNISHPKQWLQIKQKKLLKTFDIAVSKDNKVDLFKAEEELILINLVRNSRQIPKKTLKNSAQTLCLDALAQVKPQTTRDGSPAQTGTTASPLPRRRRATASITLLFDTVILLKMQVKYG